MAEYRIPNIFFSIKQTLAQIVKTDLFRNLETNQKHENFKECLFKISD